MLTVRCDRNSHSPISLFVQQVQPLGGQVSWSRLQPSGRGELDPESVRFYRDLLGGLRARGVEPFVSLHHRDLPAALEADGGWAERGTAALFAGYARRTVGALGDLATHWITLSEPWCPAFLAHGHGTHAPRRTDLNAAVATAHHLCLAHGLATIAIREAAPRARVGITNRVTDIVAACDSAADRAAAGRLDAIVNRLFLDPIYHGRHGSEVLDCVEPLGLWALVRTVDLEIISAPTDFAGIRRSERMIAYHDPAAPFEAGQHPARTAGRPAPSDPLHEVLTRVATEYTRLPLYVTESDADHPDEAAPLRDEERVDHRTRERVPTLSALWYRDLVVAHGAVSEMDSVPAA
ncbi:family 1 glycosylhydrolase [Sphaerisporangium aureirubrum]|uniref:family 1 glycosylhydrolase n=1 Tax=Sphaerisporangium aureirubrum TaxID=1544736 RepID=UPI0036D2A36B